MISRKSLMVTGLLISLPVLVMALPGKVVFRRTLHKEYQVGDKALLHLGNKYGKIELHTWNRNIIQATIIISGYGRNRDEAERIAGLVSINGSQSGNSGDVSISTSYNKPSAGFSGIWHLLFNGGASRAESYVNIDYVVYLPSTLRMLDVQDNYGEVNADLLSTPCDIAINYCHYDLDKVTGPLKLRMNYSSGMISQAVSISLNARYSTLDNEETGSINTDSRYSNYRLSRVGAFSLNSDYDVVRIDQLRDISGSSDYTHYRVGELDGSADLHISYGDFRVVSLGKLFRMIRIVSAYGGVYLGINPGTAFRLDAQLSYGNLNTGGIAFDHVLNSTHGGKKSFLGQSRDAMEISPLISFSGSYADLVLDDR